MQGRYVRRDLTVQTLNLPKQAFIKSFQYLCDFPQGCKFYIKVSNDFALLDQFGNCPKDCT